MTCKSSIVKAIFGFLALLYAFDFPADAQTVPNVDFVGYLKSRYALGSDGSEMPRLVHRNSLECAIDKDILARRVLSEYGSMFAATETVRLPPKCIFRDSGEVRVFQAAFHSEPVIVFGTKVELQPVALEAFRTLFSTAQAGGIKISLLDEPVASKRTYNDTVRIWNKRFYPALEFWVSQGIIGSDESYSARNVSLADQARKVIEWESRGFKFGTGRGKSIFASTAPPGTSQHLSMLAIDIAEYADPEVIAVLNAGGWYQTIVDDAPHFTYLGISGAELPSRGLRKAAFGGFTFWIPNINPETQ